MLKLGQDIDFNLIERKFIIINENSRSCPADFNLPLIHGGPILDEDYIDISEVWLIQGSRPPVIFSNSIHSHLLLREYNILPKCRLSVLLTPGFGRGTIR